MPKAAEGENDLALQAPLSVAKLFGVAGKVVLITGGGSGIGAMIAAGYVRNGCKVYIASRKDCSAYAAELSKEGPGSCTALTCDVGSLDDQKKVIGAIDKADGKLNVLVNNSGTNYNAPLEKYQPEMFQKVLEINTNAIFTFTQTAAPLLMKAGTQEDPARVINISSNNGLVVPKMPTFAYSTSKAAVLMLSKHLAQELGPKHVTVNSICPGPFQSRMMRATIQKAGGEEVVSKATALGRLGSPEDAAGACVFLSSRAGAWVTGTEFALDGGQLIARARM